MPITEYLSVILYSVLYDRCLLLYTIFSTPVLFNMSCVVLCTTAVLYVLWLSDRLPRSAHESADNRWCARGAWLARVVCVFYDDSADVSYDGEIVVIYALFNCMVNVKFIV